MWQFRASSQLEAAALWNELQCLTPQSPSRTHSRPLFSPSLPSPPFLEGERHLLVCLQTH